MNAKRNNNCDNNLRAIRQQERNLRSKCWREFQT